MPAAGSAAPAGAMPAMPQAKGKTMQNGGSIVPSAAESHGGDELLKNVFSAFDRVKKSKKNRK